jgi:membrane-associated phospholipid phosphatase
VPRRPTVPLLVSLCCLLGLGLTGLLALSAPGAHERDAAVLHGFTALDRPGVHGAMELAAHSMDPLPYALAGLGLLVVALAQRRWWRAAAAPLLLVGTGATTHALKHALAQPRFEAWLGHDQIGPAAFPSGHATAAMTIALCAVLVAPPALRALAAVAGGLGAAAVGSALVVLAWHFPSDVLGGYLVAGAWTAAALAGLRIVEQRPRERRAGAIGLARAA